MGFIKHVRSHKKASLPLQCDILMWQTVADKRAIWCNRTDRKVNVIKTVATELVGLFCYTHYSGMRSALKKNSLPFSLFPRSSRACQRISGRWCSQCTEQWWTLLFKINWIVTNWLTLLAANIFCNASNWRHKGGFWTVLQPQFQPVSSCLQVPLVTTKTSQLFDGLPWRFEWLAVTWLFLHHHQQVECLDNYWMDWN